MVICPIMTKSGTVVNCRVDCALYFMEKCALYHLALDSKQIIKDSAHMAAITGYTATAVGKVSR